MTLGTRKLLLIINCIPWFIQAINYSSIISLIVRISQNRFWLGHLSLLRNNLLMLYLCLKLLLLKWWIGSHNADCVILLLLLLELIEILILLLLLSNIQAILLKFSRITILVLFRSRLCIWTLGVFILFKITILGRLCSRLNSSAYLDGLPLLLNLWSSLS